MRPTVGGALMVSGVVMSSVLVSVAPSYAAVGTVSASGSVVTVMGTDGWDQIFVQSSALATRIEVATSPEFAAGSGCALDDDPSTDLVICELGSSGRVEIDAGGGDDGVEIADDLSPNTQIVTKGGPGRDFLRGGFAIEEWDGGEGDDMLFPDYAGHGPDVVRGGAGRDQLNMGRWPGVSVSLDDLPNDTVDGMPFQDDMKSDLEILVGGWGDDFFVGNDLSQTFDGGTGDDTIVGLGGDDIVGGSEGSDRIEGGDGRDGLYGSVGDDRIDGGAGEDTLFGESGDDTLTGGPGTDTIIGDAGDLTVTGSDTIHAVDGEKDLVSCGPGADTADVDILDTVSTTGSDTCENVQLTPSPSPAPLPPSPGSPPTAAPTAPPTAVSVALITSRVLMVTRLRSTRLSVLCTSGTGSCQGRVTVRKQRTLFAKARYNVASGRRKMVPLPLTLKGRAALQRRSSVRVVVTLRAADGRVTRRHCTMRRA